MRRLLRIIPEIFTPIRIVIFVVAGIFFLFLILGDQGVLQLNKLVCMKNELMNKKEALNQNISRLNKEKELLYDKKNLELVIRKELGYIKPGEIVYQVKEEPNL